MSTSSSGLASRSFIIGSRLWPPAITRASGPALSSSAIAFSTLVARCVLDWCRCLRGSLLVPGTLLGRLLVAGA